MTRQHAAPDRGQLPLAVNLRDDAHFDNFLTRPGLESPLAALRLQAKGAGESFIYLCGPPGAGKSHLLQACCQVPGASAQYLPLSQLRNFAPAEVLSGLDTLELVCLDDLHAVAGSDEWEVALFNFYNAAQKSGCRLLVAALEPPRALDLALEDLRSRLSSAVVFRLGEATDEEKAAILTFRAERRGMALSPDTASYIVSRAPRALHDLLALLDTLDEASLVSKRPVSIPFVRETLRW
ncbi:MAG: DnaA regulatory inactivator Hda [Halioglobus sp.]